MAGRAEFHSYLDIFERIFLCFCFFFMFSYLTLFLLHKILCNTFFSDITTVIVIFIYRDVSVARQLDGYSLIIHLTCTRLMR